MLNPLRHLSLLILATSLTLAGPEPQTVKNGLRPENKALTIVLEKDLEVGPEGGDTMLWVGATASVDVDEKGNMYVCDPAGQRIVVINPQGEFVKQIGQPGQGPGEFQALISYQILANGHGVAFEPLQAVSALSVFNASGEFVERKNHSGLDMMIQNLSFSPNGKLASSMYVEFDPATAAQTIHIGILDDELALVHQLSQRAVPAFNPQRATDPDYWAEFLSMRFQDNSQGWATFATFDAHNRVYTATAHTYEITRWSPDLKPERVFTKDYEKIPMTKEQVFAAIDPILETIRQRLPAPLQSVVTDKVVEHAIDMAEFPPYKHPIANITCMNDGHILVIHDINPIDNTSTGHLFTDDGTFLGKFHHTAYGIGRMVFKNGLAYTLEVNEDDDNILTRYKYRIQPAD